MWWCAVGSGGGGWVVVVAPCHSCFRGISPPRGAGQAKAGELEVGTSWLAARVQAA